MNNSTNHMICISCETIINGMFVSGPEHYSCYLLGKGIDEDVVGAGMVLMGQN